MEEINQNRSPTATLDPTAKQPRPLVLALLLTAILYFGVKQPSDRQKVVNYNTSTAQINLSVSVKNAVLQDLSQREGVPPTALTIVEAKQFTQSDRCSEVVLPKCSETLVSGWQITVVSANKRWVYRINTSGSSIYLDKVIPSSEQKSQGISIAKNSGVSPESA